MDYNADGKIDNLDVYDPDDASGKGRCGIGGKMIFMKRMDRPCECWGQTG
ncbi:MAG: hypothetical protein ACLT3Y_06510 [Ruminococcus callidus]